MKTKTLHKDQHLILVDKKGKVIGSEEKWQAHKKGILHKAFTALLFYNGKAILQKRKHVVFDKVVDFTASSHPLLIKNKPQNEREAVYTCLRREWGVDKKDLKNLKDIGAIYYRAKDKNGYIEHEICTFYTADINHLPVPDFKFAYGFELVELDFLKKNNSIFPLAPWVEKALLKLPF